MTEIVNDLDQFLQSDSNRTQFISFLKTVSTNQSIDNILTLYLLICCFKNQISTTDPSRVKKIMDKTYKMCIVKHEAEIEHILGAQIAVKLSECLKTGLYDQKLLDQVRYSIKKMLENDYLPMYLKPEKHVNNKPRASSSSLTPASSGMGSKTGSTLSLNQIIPNPYHVKTKPVKASNNIETRSMFESSKSSKKSMNTSSRQMKPKTIETNPAEFLNIVTSKLKNIHIDSPSHVSRIKSAKSKVNQTVVRQSAPNPVQQQGVKTTVAYYMPGESLAYISAFNGSHMTLAQFKNFITKRGNYRYFFKTKTDLLDDECVVFQEETNDNAVLPMFNDKIIAKIEYR